MSGPTFVAEYESTGFPTGVTPQTVSVTAAVDDFLVCYGLTQDVGRTLGTPTGGAGLVWTLATSLAGITNFGNAYIWTATAVTAETFTFSLAGTDGGGQNYCFDVLRFSGSGGKGAVAATHATATAPSLNITTITTNSAVVVANVDWQALDGTSRTWRTGAGALTETTYARDATSFAVYGGYHANSGTAGVKTVGLSAPSGQDYSIVAVEVLPAASKTPPYPGLLTSCLRPYFG